MTIDQMGTIAKKMKRQKAIRMCVGALLVLCTLGLVVMYGNASMFSSCQDGKHMQYAGRAGIKPVYLCQ